MFATNHGGFLPPNFFFSAFAAPKRGPSSPRTWPGWISGARAASICGCRCLVFFFGARCWCVFFFCFGPFFYGKSFLGWWMSRQLHNIKTHQKTLLGCFCWKIQVRPTTSHGFFLSPSSSVTWHPWRDRFRLPQVLDYLAGHGQLLHHVGWVTRSPSILFISNIELGL